MSSANKLCKQCSGSVVECLTRDRGAAGSSLDGVTALCPWARHINPSLVLVQHRKTRPYITERLLMGRKESNQTKTICKQFGSRSSPTKRWTSSGSRLYNTLVVFLKVFFSLKSMLTIISRSQKINTKNSRQRDTVLIVSVLIDVVLL